MANFFVLKNNDFSFVIKAISQIEINLKLNTKFQEFNGNKFIPFFYDYYQRKLPSYIPENILNSKSPQVFSSNESLTFFRHMFDPLNGNFGSKSDEGEQKRFITIPESVHKNKSDIILDAIFLLSKTNPWLYNLLNKIITHIVPCESNKQLGMTGGLFLGIMFFSVNNRLNSEFDISKLSVKISHEIAHDILFMYEYLEPLIYKEYRDIEIYSPQRKVNRNLSPAFHAIAVSIYEFFVYEKLINSRELSEKTKEKHFEEARELIHHMERGLNDFEGLKIEMPKHTQQIIKECIFEFSLFKKIFN
jgi:hypothetical protein